MIIKSPEDFHNKLGYVFHALLALPLAAFVFLFLEIKHRGLQPALAGEDAVFVAKIVLGVLAVAITAVGYFAFKKGLRKVNDYPDLAEKLAAYFKVSLRFYAWIGISAVLFVVGLYLTTGTIFIIGYVLLLFLMSLNRPHLQKYLKDLKLTKGERETMKHKKPFEDTTTRE